MTKLQIVIIGLLCTACGTGQDSSLTEEAMLLDSATPTAANVAGAGSEPVQLRWSGIQVCQGSSDYPSAGYVSIKKQTSESQLEGFTHTKTTAALEGLRLGTHPDYSCPVAVDVDAIVAGIQGATDFEADVDRLVCKTTGGRNLWLRSLSGWEYEGSLRFTVSIFSEGVYEEQARQAHQRDLDASAPAELFSVSCAFELELH